jgi:hypothetical protein
VGHEKHKKSRKAGSQQRCKQFASEGSALAIEGPFFVHFCAFCGNSFPVCIPLIQSQTFHKNL